MEPGELRKRLLERASYATWRVVYGTIAAHIGRVINFPKNAACSEHLEDANVVAQLVVHAARCMHERVLSGTTVASDMYLEAVVIAHLTVVSGADADDVYFYPGTWVVRDALEAHNHYKTHGQPTTFVDMRKMEGDILINDLPYSIENQRNWFEKPRLTLGTYWLNALAESIVYPLMNMQSIFIQLPVHVRATKDATDFLLGSTDDRIRARLGTTCLACRHIHSLTHDGCTHSSHHECDGARLDD